MADYLPEMEPEHIRYKVKYCPRVERVEVLSIGILQ
jgi:hypothetical protein